MINLRWRGLELAGVALQSRALQFNSSDDTAGTGDMGFQFQNNSTSTFTNELKFAAAKSVRTSIVTLASFNVLVAFLTALGIFWDGYKAAKKRDPNFNLRSSLFKVVGPENTFPFILCWGIVAQGITFAVSQSKGFESLSILGCTPISQAMLPAVLITPFIQFVLGVETAIRAVLRRPFPARAKWVIPACLAIVGLFLIITIVITQVSRPPNFCFASLYWLVIHWKLGVFIILTMILAFLFFSAIIIFLRLRSNASIDPVERVAASRMVYYLATAVVSLACIVPFFAKSIISDPNTARDELVQYGMVASVVGNLTGLILGGSYIYLRSKKSSAMSQNDWDVLEKQMDFDREEGKNPYGAYREMPASPQRSLESFNSNDEWFNRIQQPLSAPQGVALTNPATQKVHERQEPGRPIFELDQDTLAPPAPANRASSAYGPMPATPRWVLPTTTYVPPGVGQASSGVDSLLPPPGLRSPDGIGHRRASSLESTATVQIGLRLSNVEDVPDLQLESYRARSDSIHDLNCPKLKEYSGGRKTSPLANETTDSGDEDDEEVGEVAVAIPIGRPAPLSLVTSRPQKSEDDEIRLSPDVYKPPQPASRNVNNRMSTESGYEVAVPDPLFSRKNSTRKDSAWI